MSTLWKDIHRSLRTLVKRPAFFAVAVVTLGFGIGANTALFSVVNAVLLRQLPFRNADRTFRITEMRPERTRAQRGISGLGVCSQRVGPGHVGRCYPIIRLRIARRSVLPGSASDEDRSARYPSDRLDRPATWKLA